MTSKESFWDGFLSLGNTMQGTVAQLIGKNSIAADGSGSLVQVGDNVIFNDVRIEMPEGAAKLIIGSNVKVKGLIQIAANSTVSIGSDTIFNRNCHLSAWEGASVHIGKECLFSDVRIRTSDMHSIIDISSGQRINPAMDTVIEDHVWLGEGVTVYKGVTIGAGSIVGGHSVVTQPIGKCVSAAGIPARVIRTEVTWQRELKKLDPRGARALHGKTMLPTKPELTALISQKKYNRVIYNISEYLRLTGAALSDIETYAQFYFAKAQAELGDLDAAIENLRIVVRRNPNHKVAAEMLSRLTETEYDAST